MSKPCIFGARLRAALTDAEMTQAELARRLSYSEPQISRWMAGDREPRLSDLVRVAEILGRPLDYFAGRNQPPENETPNAVPEYGIDEMHEHPAPPIMVAVVKADIARAAEKRAEVQHG